MYVLIGVCTYVANCVFIFDMNMSNFIDEMTLTKKNKWKDKIKGNKSQLYLTKPKEKGHGSWKVTNWDIL